MTLLTTGFGRALVSRPVSAAFGHVAPVLGVASLAFGVWYGAAAWSVFPYPLLGVPTIAGCRSPS